MSREFNVPLNSEFVRCPPGDISPEIMPLEKISKLALTCK